MLWHLRTLLETINLYSGEDGTQGPRWLSAVSVSEGAGEGECGSGGLALHKKVVKSWSS